jgi:hypothetical protein
LCGFIKKPCEGLGKKPSRFAAGPVFFSRRYPSIVGEKVACRLSPNIDTGICGADIYLFL